MCWAGCLTGVVAALAVIASMIVLVQFVELSHSVGVRADVGPAEDLRSDADEVPSVIQVLLPFVFWPAASAPTSARTARANWWPCAPPGSPPGASSCPSAFAAFALGALAVGLLNPVAARSPRASRVDRARMMENYLGDMPKDVWLRQGDERTQMVIHAKARDTVAGAVRPARGLAVHLPEEQGRPARVQAPPGGPPRRPLRPGFWDLRDVREAGAGESSVRSDSLSIRSTLDSEAAVERFASPEAIAFWKLPAAIHATEQAGFSAAGYRLRFQQLLATPLLFAAMSILAAAFSLRLARLGGLAGLAGAGGRPWICRLLLQPVLRRAGAGGHHPGVRGGPGRRPWSRCCRV